MDSNTIVNTVSAIPIGTVIGWVAFVGAIIAAICTGTIKLYKVFAKYTELKETHAKQAQLLQKHDNDLKNISDSLKMITKSLEEQKIVNLKQIRHEIVNTCDDAIASGSISAGKCRSLEEMFEEYTNMFHGNGYVAVLMSKVRELPVVGRLDE